jgi:dihydroneopterin aldolase
LYVRYLQSIEESSYYTLEAFATNVARVACHLPGASLVTVRAYKPAGLAFAGSSGVEITRDRNFFLNMDFSVFQSLQ